MDSSLQLLAIFALLSGAVCLFALITAWRRVTTGSLSLSLLLIAMIVWSIFYSARLMNLSPGLQILLLNLMYVGVATLPTLFLIFILDLTRNVRWLSRRNLVLLSIEPLVSLLLLWTNPFHRIFYLSIRMVEDNGFLSVELVRGPWYYANTTYSYVLILLALIILSVRAMRSGPLFHYQYRLMLVGSVIPAASSLYSEAYFKALHGFDLAPVTFGLSGIIFVFAVLRARLLDLIPMARSYLIEKMCDGILVIDPQNRIIDINPAMQTFLRQPPLSYIGKDISQVFAGWVPQPDALWEQMETRSELAFPGNPSRYLELRIRTLYDKNETLNGRLMVFHEITEGKRVEKRLREANDRLQTQLIEIGLLQSQLREQAIRDPLTNLFNRRYLEETLDREIARAARENYPVSLIMIDLDHFKRVNDTYGHEAGDYVLRAIADMIAEHSRRGDFACRYGGEEFVVVMPNSHKNAACERAKWLRDQLNSLHLAYECHHLSITTSMGIACFPQDGVTRQSLLRAADKAMYASKQAGRDHILAYDQIQMIRILPEG